MYFFPGKCIEGFSASEYISLGKWGEFQTHENRNFELDLGIFEGAE